MEPKDGQLDGYIPVSRGLQAGSGFKGIDHTSLGMHWTTDPNVSRAFAGSRWPKKEHVGGVVVHGLVHKDHVLKNDDPAAVERGVLPAENSNESEVSVKPGSPVKITKVVHYRDRKDKKGSSVKAPKEGKA